MRLCAGCGTDLTMDEEHNEQECVATHQRYNAMCVGPAPKAPPDRFPLLMVSQGADNKIADLEQALHTMAAATTPQQTNDAYALLCQCRKALYSHIEELEVLTKRTRTVRRRF